MAEKEKAHCPSEECGRRNFRFNRTEGICVCNICGRTGTRAEFGIKDTADETPGA